MVVKNRAVDVITGHLKGTDSLPFCLRVIICRLPADASLTCHKCWSVSQQVSHCLAICLQPTKENPGAQRSSTWRKSREGIPQGTDLSLVECALGHPRSEA